MIQILVILLLSSISGWSQEKRFCNYKTPEDAQVMRVTCNDGSVFSYKSLNDTPLRTNFDPYCSNLLIGESKAEAKLRLLSEDIFRVAYGNEPKCYEPERENELYLQLAKQLKSFSEVEVSLQPKLLKDCALPDPVQIKLPPRNQSDFKNKFSNVSHQNQNLALKFKEDFYKTNECPKSSKYLEFLENLSSKAQIKGHRNNDVQSLIVKPKDPSSSKTDPSLPVFCGYDKLASEWKRISIHCKNLKECYVQSFPDKQHNCWKFEPEGESWKGAKYCGESWVAEDIHLFQQIKMDLIPIAEGVFLRIMRSKLAGQIELGLVFFKKNKE